MLIGNGDRYNMRSGKIGLAKVGRAGSVQPIYADAEIE